MDDELLDGFGGKIAPVEVIRKDAAPAEISGKEVNPIDKLPIAVVGRLYRCSRTINAVIMLLSLSVAYIALTGFVYFDRSHFTFTVIGVASTLLSMLVTFVIMHGFCTRATWSRYFGSLCSFFVIFFYPPVGTLLGVTALYSFARDGRLFGPKRFKHIDLELRYRELRRQKKYP